MSLEIKSNIREQFCPGSNSCPIRQTVKELEKISAIDRAKRICFSRGLEDQTQSVSSGLPLELTEKVFVGSCTKRLPNGVNYTDCGSVFIQENPHDTEELAKIKYTEEPVPGESPLVESARVITWILFQLNPDQLKEYLHLDPEKDFSIVAATESWRKAMIKLVENDHELKVGLTLDHPGINWESFIWRRLEVFLRRSDDTNLDVNIINHTQRRREIIITTQNIYQDEESETIVSGTVPAYPHSLSGTLPLPPLVEGIPSILMSLREGKYEGDEELH